DGAQRPRDLVGHRTAGVEDYVEDPAFALAPGQHDVSAVGAAARRADERAFGGRHGFEPALQGHFPGSAIQSAQGGHTLVGASSLVPASLTFHRVDGRTQAEGSRSRLRERFGPCFLLVGGLLGEPLPLQLVVEHVAPGAWSLLLTRVAFAGLLVPAAAT